MKAMHRAVRFGVDTESGDVGRPRGRRLWLFTALVVALAGLAIGRAPVGHAWPAHSDRLSVRHAEQQQTTECNVTRERGFCWLHECQLLTYLPLDPNANSVIVTCWQEGQGGDAPPGAVRPPFNLAVWIAGTSERVTDFYPPLFLVAFYQDQEVAEADEHALAIVWYDTQAHEWRVLDELSVDEGRNEIVGRMEHLVGTRFAIVNVEHFATQTRSLPSATWTPTLTLLTSPTSTPIAQPSPTMSPTPTTFPVPSPTPTPSSAPTFTPSPTSERATEVTATRASPASPSPRTTPQRAETPTLPGPGASDALESLPVWAYGLAIAVGIAGVVAWWRLSRRRGRV